jgi:predicted phage terminase large subunit-like protein
MTAADILMAIGTSLNMPNPTLREYIRGSWQVLEPAHPLTESWHIDCIAEHLEAVDAGQIQFLDINLPPRYLKSVLVSINWPTWSWISQPHTRWIFASYSASLSTKHSTDRRDIIKSDWYQSQWGDMVRLSDDQDQKTEFKNTARGAMMATSVGGTVTGKGGNRIVMDDLINPEMAESKPERESAIRFYRNTLRTRLDDKEHGAIVHVGQRLHKFDLSAALRAEGGWTHLVLPAEAPIRMVVNFPMTKNDFVREQGNVLCAARESKERLAQQKNAMGTRTYNAQYQQTPSDEEGAFFKRGWWKFYREVPTVKRSATSWDTAVKEKQTSDYSAKMRGMDCENGYYIDPHFLMDRMAYPTLKRAVQMEQDARPSDAIVVEDKSSGQQVIQDLQHETNLPIIPFTADKDKVIRANLVAPLVEAGKVFLPEGAPWVADFIENAANFPDVTHDDDIDSFTALIMYLSGKTKNGIPTIWVG